MRSIQVLAFAIAAAVNVCVLDAVAADAPKMLYELDFENGNLDGWRGVGKPVHPMPQLTQEVTRSGKYAVKSFLDSANPDPEIRERTEMVADRSAEAAKIGGEYWYGWSVYLASPYPVDKTHPELLTQFHNTMDQGEISGKNPTLSFQIRQNSDHWTIVNCYDPRPLTTDLTQKVIKFYDGGKFAVDEWTDWVVHVKWSYQNDGFMQIWKNGDIVVDIKGPTSFNDRLGPHFKFGVYKSAWNKKVPDSVVKTRLAYQDEFRMTGADGSYEAVAPRGSKLSVKPKAPVLVNN